MKTISVKIDAGYELGGFAGGGINAPYSTGPYPCAKGVCKVTETFQPAAVGQYNTTLGVSECPIAGGFCVNLVIPVSGVGGVFTAKPVNFGSLVLNTSKSKTFTLKLDPGYTLGAQSGGGINAPYSAAAAPCVKGKCKITETFSPTTLGQYDTTLNVAECPVVSGPCNNIAIPLHGNAGV